MIDGFEVWKRKMRAVLCTTFVIGLLLTILASQTTVNALSSQLKDLYSSLKDTLKILDSIKEDEISLENELLTGLGRPSSCAELLLSGRTKSGLYTIFPRLWYKTAPFQVYCDMKTDGGGWTVFQRRDDYGEPIENFYRNWKDYQKGFGNLTKAFWLGNEHLFILTNQDHVTLRVDLEDFEGGERYANYGQFQVADKDDDFRVQIGKYKGDVGDGLSTFNNYVFVTHDRNDVHNCSAKYKGGWWYRNCHNANLNGKYLKGNHSSHANGVNWYAWRGNYYSLKKSEMKIRPTHFLRCEDDRVVTPS